MAFARPTPGSLFTMAIRVPACARRMSHHLKRCDEARERNDHDCSKKDDLSFTQSYRCTPVVRFVVDTSRTTVTPGASPVSDRVRCVADTFIHAARRTSLRCAGTVRALFESFFRRSTTQVLMTASWLCRLYEDACCPVSNSYPRESTFGDAELVGVPRGSGPLNKPARHREPLGSGLDIERDWR